MEYYYFFFLWPLLSGILLWVIQKRWGKKNHLALSIFYAIFLLWPMIFEKLIEKYIRHKYAKHTGEILTFLTERGFKYHLGYGSFLFAYRNQTFGDSDIDLGVYVGDWNAAQVKILNEAGFMAKEEWRLGDELRELSFYHPTKHMHLDVFLIYPRADFAQGFDEKHHRYARTRRLYQYEVKPYEVNGVKFNGPSDPEAYLNWLYGDWQTPDPNYHWFYGSSSNPPLIVETDQIRHTRYH